ncbi:hypothetical protein EV424DRAFT_1344933 [Suillus variegatus]|nr:hypothetical protein EV424DRAFT_1344933 [Suillus variegatus]
MCWDLRDAHVRVSHPQIISVAIPCKREVDYGEFSHGVIHELHTASGTGTSQSVGHLGTRPVNQHLPPAPTPAPVAPISHTEFDKPTVNAIKNAHISIIGQVKYKSFEKNSLREELIMCMSNVRCLFRDHATNIVQMALNLHLPITSGLGDKVAHKGDDGTEYQWLLEADYFIEMLVDVIWQKGLHNYIDLDWLDSAIALGGAAVRNALKAHRTGRSHFERKVRGRECMGFDLNDSDNADSDNEEE